AAIFIGVKSGPVLFRLARKRGKCMKLLALLRSMSGRARIEKDTDEELRAHVLDRAEDLERSGLTRAEAERRARIEFGGHERFKEECREVRGGFRLETVWTDIRFGARMLRKSPGFTAVDRKSTRLNSSHLVSSYAVFCLKKNRRYTDD